MKTKLLVALAMLMSLLYAHAVPACPEPAKVTQPDGTTLTIRLVGDEFFNYNLTADGRVVMQSADGAYVYAEQDATGALVPSTVVAHDPTARSAAERNYLASAAKVTPRPSSGQSTMRRQQRAMINGQKEAYNYDKFRGLVILVNFTDMKFSYTNANELFTNMVTQKNYTGFMNNAQISTKETYTGSVRDYFYDNSSGRFDPNFDVVGPVDIDVAATYPRQTTLISSVVRKVISAADSQVDFSKYDTDNDGVVDMFYIIFAGYGSNFSGNNTNYVWPHAWDVSSFFIRADGVSLGRYACSTEFYGTPSSHCIDGIGTICHEFSHVLGLMDEYDTDYEDGGGQSVDPGDWSVMAGGSYLNRARTPVGYSLFERYQSGFAVPKVITSEGEYSLVDIDASNTGYRINIPNQPKEYFLLENRRKTGNKWNSYGPGQGMLVFRVDSTNTSVWSSNDINANPAHNYYELLRAKYNGRADSGSDPFPGTAKINKLMPEGTPAFKSWAGLNPEFGLDSIWEKDNIIYFRIGKDATKSKLETFENMTTTGKNDANVRGEFTNWTFNDAWVETMPDGNHALAMMKKSTAETAVIPNGWIINCSFKVINTTGESAFFRLQAKENGSYQNMTGSTGSTLLSVGANSTSELSYTIPNLANTSLLLTLASGANSDPVHIDDFRIVKDYPTGVENVSLDNDNPTLWALRSGDAIKVITTPGALVSIYDLRGQLVMKTLADPAGIAMVRPDVRGIYIITSGSKSLKFMYL